MSLEVSFCNITYKNPIITSSGTFGYGYEFHRFFNVNALGGITLKALTKEPWAGNPSPRVCETETGMLNSIGLQNAGFEKFKKEIYPRLQKEINTNIHVNISGFLMQDYVHLVEKLSDLEDLQILELNVSCPNTEGNKMPFGSDEKVLGELLQACKKVTKKPLVVKLSPSVASISQMAKVCEDSGADAISLVNTFLGLKIDLDTRKPYIANNFAGYSGAGIKPIALKMVYEASKAVKIPIIGIGGVMHWEDVVEYLLAGATLVGVGTANLLDPLASEKILKGFEKYMKKNNFNTTDLIGAMKLN